MKHQQKVYLTHPKMPALVHGILKMPRPSSLVGGVIGLFLLTWVSLWAQVAPAGTIFNQLGPFTGDPIPITTFPDSDALDLTVTDFTISACVYQARRSNVDSSAILTKRGSDNGWGLLLEGKSSVSGDTGIVKFRSLRDGVNELVASSRVLSLRTKHHVAVVYQGGVAQIFINGVLDGSSGIRPPKAPGKDKPLRVGGDFDYTTNTDRYRWRGTLLNLQIDNTALSQAQIQTLRDSCARSQPCPCLEPNDIFECLSPCLTPVEAIYTEGVIHIPQLSIGGSKSCNVYLLQQPLSPQQPTTFNFTLDLGRLICSQ